MMTASRTTTMTSAMSGHPELAPDPVHDPGREEATSNERRNQQGDDDPHVGLRATACEAGLVLEPFTALSSPAPLQEPEAGLMIHLGLMEKLQGGIGRPERRRTL